MNIILSIISLTLTIMAAWFSSVVLIIISFILIVFALATANMEN